MRMRTTLLTGWIFAGLSVVGSAQAHFYLQNPPSWQTQGSLGDPQKAPPCGNEAGGTATGVVTPYTAGQTIDVTLEERFPHPGHYRVSIAVNNRSELPPEPAVTPGTQACGTTVIQNPPVFPVLVDGALKHTTPLTGMQTIKVKLPDNVTCTKCTLQIIEFMSEHGLNNPGGCFYHHCADISIRAATGTGGTGGSGAMGAGGTSGSGGANGNGGTDGRGGVSGSGSGGASGSGSGGVNGSGSGGASGSGGVSGSGSGGVSGAGTVASGGVGGSGMGAASAENPATDESGCSCSVPGRPEQLAGFAAVLAAFLGLAWRRRRS